VSGIAAIQERIRESTDRYRSGHERPLGGYAALAGTYIGVTGVLTAIAGRTKRVPALRADEVVLYGIATHKLARILTKEAIASPLRAPFTTYEGVSGPAELAERVRSSGWRKAVGELVTCPFCSAQWIATGFVFGAGFAPAVTRAIATTFVVHAISDALQFGYARLTSST
jgi:hypothetical protein